MLKKFLAHNVCLRTTPSSGAHARRILRADLVAWLAQTDADGWSWGQRLKWDVDGEPTLLYRADGAQTMQEVIRDYGRSPEAANEGVPSFWSPSRNVARLYAHRHSQEIWVAKLRPRKIYWLFRQRDCVQECNQLLKIFVTFMGNVLHPVHGRRSRREVPTTGNVEEYLHLLYGRTSWPGDLLAAGPSPFVARADATASVHSALRLGRHNPPQFYCNGWSMGHSGSSTASEHSTGPRMHFDQ